MDLSLPYPSPPARLEQLLANFRGPHMTARLPIPQNWVGINCWTSKVSSDAEDSNLSQHTCNKEFWMLCCYVGPVFGTFPGLFQASLGAPLGTQTLEFYLGLAFGPQKWTNMLQGRANLGQDTCNNEFCMLCCGFWPVLVTFPGLFE